MSKKHIQFILIFLIAMILFGSVSPLTYAQTPSPPSNTNNIFLDKTFLQSVAVAIFSAVLAFLGGYALAGISKKSGSGKRLSYSLNIESGLVNIDKDLKNKVKVLYENQEIVNL
jgi:membrane associated rhomboid family serine protease